MINKYLIAKTFKKKGSAAISLTHVPDFLSYIPHLEDIFKRNAEFLILSADAEKELDEAWPEYAPFQLEETKAAFEAAVKEKTTREKK
ncbi:DUF6718 family protein [Jeotgalibaca caeni]|uniref:DUF6718 family protein n=1 Tax=Jeotgalibaca caeni TaxID=3028623 RepID=UPI00237DF1CF|nr:DUF6718 family protein [Jeotgalibaca caeni]MDE1548613.1 hypothetical protein [Jeotgalibaca caeni]